MIAALGALTALGGYALGAEGKRQGANSMRNEAHKQTMEQLQFDMDRFDPVDQQIAHNLPGQRVNAMTGANMRSAAGAMVPSAQAGGSALGVRSGSLFTPQDRSESVGSAVAQRGDEDSLQTARLGLELAEIERRREMARALYDGRMARAGRKGQGLRQAGEIATTLGGAGMAYGMGQPATPASYSGAQMGSNATNVTTSARLNQSMPLNDLSWMNIGGTYGNRAQNQPMARRP